MLQSPCYSEDGRFSFAIKVQLYLFPAIGPVAIDERLIVRKLDRRCAGDARIVLRREYAQIGIPLLGAGALFSKDFVVCGKTNTQREACNLLLAFNAVAAVGNDPFKSGHHCIGLKVLLIGQIIRDCNVHVFRIVLRNCLFNTEVHG